MNLPVYAIRDKKANSFNPPVCASNDVVMCRALAEQVISKRDNLMAFAPDDFELFRVGSFDIESGVLTSEPVKLFVANVAEVVSNYGYKKE